MADPTFMYTPWKDRILLELQRAFFQFVYIGTQAINRHYIHSSLPLPWCSYTKNRALRIIGFTNKTACFNYAMFSFYHKVFLQKKHLKSCSFKPKNVNVVSVVVQAPTGFFPHVFRRGLTGKSVGFFRTINFSAPVMSRLTDVLWCQ